MKVYLETERLKLRELTLADASLLYELDNDPAVMRFINDSKPVPLEDIREKALPRLLSYYEDNQGFGFWAAVEKNGDEFIGWFHLRPAYDGSGNIELGYRIKKSAWGKGYATEGSFALIQKGFSELGLERIIARTMLANEKSSRVMEKCGFIFERNFIEEKFPGADKRAVQYSLNKSDYLALSAKAGAKVVRPA